jgi:hypothetical protein
MSTEWNAGYIPANNRQASWEALINEGFCPLPASGSPRAKVEYVWIYSLRPQFAFLGREQKSSLISTSLGCKVKDFFTERQ